jgi:N-acetylneuraminic acid mutarotase
MGFGSHVVEVTPYPYRWGLGSPGETISISFDIVAQGESAPVKPPVPAPVNVPQPAPSKPVATEPPPVSTRGIDPNGKWIEVKKFAPITKRHEACFVMVGRKAVLIGGRGVKPVDIYDPVTRKWTQGAKTPIQLHHMQCVALDGKVWIVSAWTGVYPKETNADKIYIFDPDTNKWSTKPGLPEYRRRGGAAAVVVGRKIYVSHGNRGGHETGNHATSLGWLDYYDVDKDTWVTDLPDAPNPRDHTGGALIGNKICVAGGRNGGESGWPTVAKTDCFNLATNKWSVEASIPQARAGSSYGTTCDGKLIVAGGEGGGKAWKNVDVFDGKSWTSINNLNVGRHGSGLAVDCVCNQIHIASGSASQGGGREIFSVETFFPGGFDVKCSANSGRDFAGGPSLEKTWRDFWLGHLLASLFPDP